MNCISDFDFDYHSKYGLIENIAIISINDDDCAINIFSNKSVIRTTINHIKILNKPHEKVNEIEKIDTKQNLILSIDGYSCLVKAIKTYDDNTVEVIPTSDLLLDNEPTKRVSIDNLSICGDYLTFDALKSVSIAMPCEYSRYFNNIKIFKPFLCRTKNILISWNAEELQLNIFALNDACLRKIEFLMPVFISQLAVLISGKQIKSLDLLSNYIIWEYQYENEQEANYAIGPKGSHILAVRNYKGIAGVVLTKSNRLRIIAENKYSLKEARNLLEVKQEIYLFDDSFIPILIGKNANHISELVNKAGLHCIHVPHIAWNGVLNEHVSVNDPYVNGKRELLLYGTRDSIDSAKLLLEMEESVKDLKKEFEARKNNKLKQSYSLKSSTSSISKDSNDKPLNFVGDKKQEEVFEDVTVDKVIDVTIATQSSHNEHPMLWADTQDDSAGEENNKMPIATSSDNIIDTSGTGTSNKDGAYTDFFSSQQKNVARVRKSSNKKNNQNWNQQSSSIEPPRHNNSYNNHKRVNRKLPTSQQQSGGFFFTNSSLSTGGGASVTIQDEFHNGEDLHKNDLHHQQQQQYQQQYQQQQYQQHYQHHLIKNNPIINHRNRNNNNNNNNNIKSNNNSNNSNNNHNNWVGNQNNSRSCKNNNDNRRQASTYYNTTEENNISINTPVLHQATL